jgi:hypothetical protein
LTSKVRGEEKGRDPSLKNYSRIHKIDEIKHAINAGKNVF